MEYYELTITTYLKRDTYFNEINETLSKTIIKAMSLDKKLLEKHLDKGYKHYVFSGLYPIEADKLYKEGRIYIYRMRTPDLYLSSKMQKYLLSVNDDIFKNISVQRQVYKQKHINHIYTVTPAVATVSHKYWTPGDDFLLLEKRIQDNLEKKYKSFYKEDIIIQRPIIQAIEILNKKPIVYKYKNIGIIGNKFRIFFNTDVISQKLALVAISQGILEKCSALGMGFCLSK